VMFMDGDDQFRFAVNAYQALRAGSEVPPLLLVGVGYGASYTKPGNRRLRDYTPTQMATEPGSGGADAFLGFLTGTLWPELARRYPLREDVRGLGGHSLGSLLALHALFQRRPFFNRILASAPSLFWDHRALLRHIGRLQRAGVTLSAHLFLGVGENDTPSMTSDLERLHFNTVVAALIGAGGLGVFIFQGLGQYAADMILLGTLPVIAMAVIVDMLMGGVVRLLTPKPLREAAA
jgi:predicted alpha/beta superfamily hydrolase